MTPVYFVTFQNWTLRVVLTFVGNVILSEAKNPGVASEILRFAQNDIAPLRMTVVGFA